MKISDLIIGNVYHHQDVYETFQCGNMGGMRRSKVSAKYFDGYKTIC